MRLNSLAKFIICLLLIPLCYGTGKSFFESIIHSIYPKNKYLWMYFFAGCVVYILVQVIFNKPLKLYIFGHELTHMLAGVISGSKIKSFTIKSSSGSVKLSRVNIFISLAPYFIPIYSLILIVIYSLTKLLLRKYASFNPEWFHPLFIFLLGTTVSFHIALTLFAITQGQSDLKKYGLFYSLIVSFVSNCVVLVIILGWFFPLSVVDFLFNSIRYTVRIYVGIYTKIWPMIISHIQK